MFCKTVISPVSMESCRLLIGCSMKMRLLFVFALLALVACSGPREAYNFELEGQKAKNVVLMIGDGMGLTQVSAAMFSNNKSLAMEGFPVTGLQKTHCYDDLITDSGAGATAMACGVKTFKFAVGVNHDTVACKSILEEAEERGMATGLVATSTIVHATPAAFIAHQPMRAFHEAIAADFMDTEIDYFVGGGRNYFNKRQDNRDLILELKQNGYHISDFQQEPLEAVILNGSTNFGYFTSDKDPISRELGRRYLPFASEFGLHFLNNRSREGFFMMIEGSQIDWAGHSNDAEQMIRETLDFDGAVEKVLKYAQRKGDTLVIVTADHETGGMAIQPGSVKGELDIAFITNEHTPTMVPVFAYGPGAELFSGIYDNTEIYHKMRKALGWTGEEEEK